MTAGHVAVDDITALDFDITEPCDVCQQQHAAWVLAATFGVGHVVVRAVLCDRCTKTAEALERDPRYVCPRCGAAFHIVLVEPLHPTTSTS